MRMARCSPRPPRFPDEPQLVIADLDLGRLVAERMRQNTFGDCADSRRRDAKSFRHVASSWRRRSMQISGLCAQVARFPFVPDDEARLAEQCFEAFNIQAHGLQQRLRASKIEKLVIGVSGGLDSTQALLVAVTAMDALGLPRKNILAFTLPAFGTTDRTKSNAWALMSALGVSAQEIDFIARMSAHA